jgi:ABC-2 type transport system permease protein
LMKQTLSITRKELNTYFGSPMALIFVGAFLAASLFVFFWIDAFFARGIADVRPLFQWMPILMIFLVAALTMRQWSEEQRSGTLEILLTLPVGKIQLVFGKFLAVMALVVLALALTLFLPLTVALLGSLDWGPVLGGYLAALLMAGAYTAIGLFVSSRTDNQLVSLILTVLLCGVFYLVGARGVTDFVAPALAVILRAAGAGSRFESIQRGVVDLRDLIYYLTLTGIFLALNVWALDHAVTLTTCLVVFNLVALNFWLYPLSGLRLDLTEDRAYSLSRTTKDLLQGLSEPLTIRAYISKKTHPLLAPLIPQVTDMLREYEIAGRGKVQAEVVDPADDPEKEAEAYQTYGIQPTPLQVAGRYESSLINAYFDILVRYGDQNVVLNFRDLVSVEQQRDGTVDVRLRNLEYDLTRAVKKVVYGFQSVDAVLATMEKPVKLTLLVTTDTLPESLTTVPGVMQKVAQELQDKSSGKFTWQLVDPDAPGSPITRQQLLDTYKLQPIAASLFSDQTYYLDMILQVGDQSQVLSPAGELNEANVRTAIESALKRASTGFLKVVGLWTPPEQPTQDMFGQMQPSLRSWQVIRQQLSNDYTVQDVDLSTGAVPPDVDVLLVISPQGMGDKERYAIDQFLMRGGAIVLAAANHTAALDQLTGNLVLQPVEGGLSDMLASYGIRVEDALVMDPQNEPFPVQVDRQAGNVIVREVQAMNYPFFPDVRPDGMDKRNPIVADLPAVTVNWASPVTVDEATSQGRQVDVLLKSSSGSWLQNELNIQPDMKTYPNLGFPVQADVGSHPLAVAVRGSFESFFKGKPSPIQASAQVTTTADAPAVSAIGTIEQSPDTARLVVIGSSDFLTDVIFQISSSLNQDRYLNSLRFLQNAVDWSAEDLDLLEIRARGAGTRVLAPLPEGRQTFWEGLNYGLVVLALVGIGSAWYLRRRNEKPMKLD